MATKAFTLDDGTTTVSLTGTAPFASIVTGTASETLNIVDSTGAEVPVYLHGQTAAALFARTAAGQALVDEIVAKANA